VDITAATGIKTEIQEGVREDTVEMEKDETDEEDMVKQDEALFNREKVSEVRTESQRKPNSQHSKNWRLKGLMLTLLLLQVKVVRERVNMSAREDRFDKDTVRHGDDDDEEKTVEKHLYEKPEGRDVMTNINP
jgi:hypothetical protein